MHAFKKIITRIAISMLLITISACGGGGNDDPQPQPIVTPQPTPVPEPEPAPEPEPDFSELQSYIDNFPVADMALLIGDDSGALYVYEKGNFTIDTPINIASANKWLTGATIWRLIEKGVLSRTDHPQDYIDFWTDDANDPRSEITLDIFLGLTSGFNNSPINTECINRPIYTLYECVQQLYDGGSDSYPGTAFYYGPEHFQMAALMASTAQGGKDFREIMRDEIFDPAGMSDLTAYSQLNNDNARYSGSIVSTAGDYAKFLRGILSGELIEDLNGFIEDRTANVTFGFRPDAIDGNGVDWHYAFGFWKECEFIPYLAVCDDNPIVSSPGAFGFTPWIDINRNYWGIIAFERNDDDPNFRSSIESVALEQELQSLIEELLDEQ